MPSASRHMPSLVEHRACSAVVLVELLANTALISRTPPLHSLSAVAKVMHPPSDHPHSNPGSFRMVSMFFFENLAKALPKGVRFFGVPYSSQVCRGMAVRDFVFQSL